MRVVVVGVGLASVVAAVGVHRRGHEVTLCERASELREARGGYRDRDHANGVSALGSLGLADYARGQMHRATTSFLRDWRGRALLSAGTGLLDVEASIAVVGPPGTAPGALRAPLPACVALPVAAAWGRQQYAQPLPVIDALIAATARVHGMTVVTRNVKDFELAGVPVLNPFAE
jgi:hypothetical protein